MKKKYFVFLAFLLTFITACQDKKTQKSPSVVQMSSPAKLDERGLLNAYYLPFFLNVNGIEFLPFIFHDHLPNGLSKANFYMKNGKLPNNIYQKYTYFFNQFGILDQSSHYSQKTKYQPYSDFLFSYNNKKEVKKMDIIEYMSLKNQPPYLFHKDSLMACTIKPRTEQYSDTTYFFPSYEQPEMIFVRSNNSTIEAYIFAPTGTTKEEINLIIDKYASIVKTDQYTTLFVTYTDNNLPIESFEMSDDLAMSSKVRTWNYNKEWLPVQYNEYLHGSIIKDVRIKYDANNYPENIRINKEEYRTHYEFNHAY